MLSRAAVETMLGGTARLHVQELLLHDEHQRGIIDALQNELQRVYDESHTQVDRG